jgi:hypothetical protein
VVESPENRYSLFHFNAATIAGQTVVVSTLRRVTARCSADEGGADARDFFPGPPQCVHEAAGAGACAGDGGAQAGARTA